MPAWEAFVNTNFYIFIIPRDSDDETQDFHFSIFQSKKTQNKPVVIISEMLNRLVNLNGEKAIQITGGKLIEILHSEVGILIALKDGAFGMPSDIVKELRSSIHMLH